MKNCPKCNNEHLLKGLYCSRKCANSRVWSDEDKNLKKLKNKDWWNNLSEKDKNAWKEKNIPIMINASKIRGSKYRHNTCTTKLSTKSLRKKILEEQQNTCNICGITEWNNKPLSFELDHVDGNNKNNDRQNLRILCPNCHSQTPTWRGRKNNIVKPNG